MEFRREWVGRRFLDIFRVAMVGSLAWVGVSGAVLGQSLPAGDDCWATGAGSTARIVIPVATLTASGGRTNQLFDNIIGVVGNPSVPCGCSQVTVTWTDRHGNVVEPGDRHAVNKSVSNTIDTCVQRTSGTSWSGGGGNHNVPIQIVAMQLKSANPITVTMNDNSQCQYNVGISLDGTQSLGQMTFSPFVNNPREGTVQLNSLPVGFKTTFTAVTPGCIDGSRTGLSTTFSTTNGNFWLTIGVPAMNTWALAILLIVLLFTATWMLRRRRMASPQS